jgi:uncharacterized membrane protein
MAFIDAARGAAMFFVLLSHFSIVYFQGDARQTWGGLLSLIGMVASPTFTVVSGLLLGFLFATKGARFPAVRDKLVDRGLFLLTIGHVVIAAALWRQEPDTLWSFVRTDCIALSIVVGALMIQRVSMTTRLTLGIVGYVCSWFVIALWQPNSVAGATIERVMFGEMREEHYPFVPWFSLYIVSTVLGEHVGRAGFDTLRALARRLALASVVCMTAAGAFAVAVHRFGPFFRPHTIASNLTWVVQKHPPGPIYLLFYGGCAIAIVAALILIEHRNWPGLRFLAMNGRSSFFIFAVHPVLLDLLWLVPSRPAVAWPAYLAGFCVAMSMLALVWDRYDGNSMMTLAFLRRRSGVPAALEHT